MGANSSTWQNQNHINAINTNKPFRSAEDNLEEAALVEVFEICATEVN
jgi:hypothetical protein